MKRKGFTLIELLAVIVVLAIIALIAVPIVLNLINNAKKGAVKESSKVYAKEVENYVVLRELKNDDTIQKLEPNKKYYVSEESKILDEKPSEENIYLENLIEVDGEMPQLGYVELDNESKVKSYKLLYGKYMVEFNAPSTYEVYNYSYNNPVLKEFNVEQVGPTSTINIKASNYDKSYYNLDNGEYKEFKNTIKIENLKVGEEHTLNIKLIHENEEIVKSKKIGWIIEKEIVEGKEYNIITSEYDLDWFRNEVNKGKTNLNAKLGNDIELNTYSNWTPIGDYNTNTDNVYIGTFDGNNKTIKNLSIKKDSVNYQGLFGYIKKGGLVENLTVEGTINITNGGRIGSIAGQNEGVIDNCINKANVTGVYFVGGINGVSLNEGTLISNSKNYGEIKGTGSHPNNEKISYVGGISGHIGSSAMVKNSENYGNVSATIGLAGGITGQIANSGVVETSINKGNVTAPYLVGGIAGQMYNTTVVRSSKNYGTIKGTGNHPTNTTLTYVGGITGQVHGSKVENSENHGNVNGAKYYAGGISGETYNSTISSGFNYSAVSTSYGYAGGITGNLNASSIIENSGNIGEIKGDSVATYGPIAGITGRSINSTVNTSFNRGNITVTNGASEYRMGGIVGNCTSCNINDSYSVATLSGNKSSYSDAGGLVGHTDSGTATIKNSYAISKLVAYRTGGVVGYGSTSLTNVYTSNPDVSKLGSSFCADSKKINNGYPVLCFEN